MPQQEIQFPAGSETKEEGQLSGTLHLPSADPSSKVPGAIVLHGSGPIDREGNVQSNILGFIGNMQFHTHSRLVEALEDRVALLCYDKRGVGQSKHSHNKNWYYEAGMIDLVQDAVQAYRFLASQEAVDERKIVLIGHSEGAILLPKIAEAIQSHGDLKPPKGLVFLAGFGETLDGAARNQNETLLKEVQSKEGFEGWILKRVLTKEKLDKQYGDFMEQVKNKEQSYLSKYFGIVRAPTKWYREHLEWDAKKSLEQCTLPCLAITGGKDIQVKPEYCEPETAKTLAPKAESLETHIVPNMTHILRSTEDPPSILNLQKDYPKLGKDPLDSDLVQILRTWLDKLFK